MNKILLVMLLVVASCSQSYDRYNVRKEPYQQTKFLAADAGVASAVLIFLGLEIAHADRDQVRTKWERFMQDPNTRFATEFQARIVLDLKKGVIKAQCTQRREIGVWFFKKCTHPIVLRRIDQVVSELQRRLPVFAKRAGGVL